MTKRDLDFQILPDEHLWNTKPALLAQEMFNLVPDLVILGNQNLVFDLLIACGAGLEGQPYGDKTEDNGLIRVRNMGRDLRDVLLRALPDSLKPSSTFGIKVDSWPRASTNSTRCSL